MELQSTPAASDIRVIVGDTHGDHAGMLQALRHVGAVDERGRRADGYWLCHVGDVIHAGHGVQRDDVICLELALELFDCLLYGNHETPFAIGVGGFAGQNARLDCQALLDASVRDHRWLAATSVDGYLVCHAGLHPRLLFRDSRAFEPLRGTERLQDPVAIAAAMNDAFGKRVESGEREPLFDWVGPVRSFRTSEPCGGIFWCDWTELMKAERKPSSQSLLRQIVGHTPRRDVQRALDGRYYCVDVGAALSGYVGALVKHPDEHEWRAVRVGHSSRGRPAEDERRLPGIPG
jgi:hypothetical protein